MANEPPIFIKLGAEVILSILNKQDVESDEREIMERLRRIKLNETIKEDIDMIIICLQNFNQSDYNELTVSNLLHKLVITMINCRYWVSHFMRKAIKEAENKCPQIILPTVESTLADDFQISIRNNVEYNAHERLAHAIRVKNKIRKLKQLQKTNTILQQRVKETVLSINDADFHHHSIYDQLQQGAELMNPSTRPYISNRPKPSKVKDIHGSSQIGVFEQHEIFSELIEDLKIKLRAEDLFWKWLAPSVADNQINSMSGDILTQEYQESLPLQTTLANLDEKMVGAIVKKKYTAEELNSIVGKSEELLGKVLSGTNNVGDVSESFVERFLQKVVLRENFEEIKARYEIVVSEFGDT